MTNGEPPRRGTCYCGCGQETRNYFKQGHDRRALHFVINAECGGTAAFLSGAEEEPSTFARAKYGSIAAFLLKHGYGPDSKRASNPT